MTLKLGRYIWFVLLAVAALYALLIALFGFEDRVALGVHFGRVAVATAVLIVYFPALKKIFKQVPAPGRDYLLAGIVFSWSSSDLFAFWNEAGRVFGVDTSIFTSPLAGFFSLILVVAGVFHLAAPDSADLGEGKRRAIAIVVGVIMAAGLVFVAPLFR